MGTAIRVAGIKTIGHSFPQQKHDWQDVRLNPREAIWSILSQFITIVPKNSHLLIIVTIGHNFHDCLKFSKLSHFSQLSCHIVIYHNFLELPQLDIIFIIGQNCRYWTQLSHLVNIVTIALNYCNCYNHNCHNWSILSQLVKIITIAGLNKFDHIWTNSNKLDQVWISLDKFEHVWTSLNKFK